MQKNSAVSRSRRKCGITYICEIPGILLIVVWPFLMHLFTIRTRLEKETFYPYGAYADDYVLYIRNVVFLGIACLMTGVLIYQMIHQSSRKLLKKPDLKMDACRLGIAILMTLYAALSILSGVLSGHPDAAFLGAADSFETVPVLMGYLIAFLYAAKMSKADHYWQETVTNCFLVTALLMGLLGLSQLTGHDFWNTAAGKWILLGSREKNLIFDASLEGTRQIYLAFYNPNYAAVYLLMQFFICLAYTIKHRETGKRAAGLAVVILTLLCLYGTRSKAALLTLGILLFAGMMCTLLKTRNGFRLSAAFTAVLAAVVTVMMLMPGNNIVKEIKDNIFPVGRNYYFRNVKINDDGIFFIMSHRKVHLKILENGTDATLQVLDDQGRDIKHHWDDGQKRFVFDEEDLRNFSFGAFTEDDLFHILVWHVNVEWHFIKTVGKSDYRYINYAGKEDTIERAKLAFGKGYEKAFTRRMYIWGATCAILPRRLLLGCGPENFAYVFPQKDYVMKSILGYQASQEWHMRPHSLYLQIAMNSGVLAAICILTALALYLVTCSRQGRKAGKAFFERGFLLAVLSFLIMGLANDSMIVATPLFCLILGSMNKSE